MQKYQDVASIIGPPGLIPVVGVSVYVYTHGTTSLATIYSDNASTQTGNPLTTDNSGRYSFYAPNGHYDLTVSGAGIQSTTIADITLNDTLVVNVQSAPYNATGNGVTDDSAAINAAFTAAIAAGAGEVVFPAGTYKANATLSGYTGQNLRITGLGAKWLITGNTVGLAITGCTNVTVSGFAFSSVLASGLLQSGVSVTLSSYIRVIDNYFTLLSFGVNWISEAKGLSLAPAVQIPSLISRNIVKACSQGIRLLGTNADAAEYVTVSGNIVTDCPFWGILVQAGNVRVTDNTVLSNGIGIEIDGSQYANADHGAVIGNTINHNSSCGLYVHDTSLNYSYLITGNNIWANIYTNFGAGSYAHPFGVILKACASINFTSNIIARNVVNLAIDSMTNSMVANNSFLTDSTATLFNILEITTITVANGNKMAPNSFNGTLVASANNNDYEQTYVIGVGSAPAFANSWANFNVAFGSASYQKDASGYVHLSGLVSAGLMSNAIFTLPAGFRPLLKVVQAGISNNLLGSIQITNAGVVTAEVGTNTWQTLDGVSFKAEA